MVRFSLRSLLLTVLLAGGLFGLTFNMYGGGYTPGRSMAFRQRGADAVAGEQYWGNGHWLGLPFTNIEIYESYADSDPPDGDYERQFEETYRARTILNPVGMASNLVFWLLASWVSVRMLRRLITASD